MLSKAVHQGFADQSTCLSSRNPEAKLREVCGCPEFCHVGVRHPQPTTKPALSIFSNRYSTLHVTFMLVQRGRVRSPAHADRMTHHSHWCGGRRACSGPLLAPRALTLCVTLKPVQSGRDRTGQRDNFLLHSSGLIVRPRARHSVLHGK